MHRILFALLLTTAAHAQWDIQHSGTSADLRGIASVGAGIAWASGSNGTVLRTEDGGYLWQRCTVPPGAEKLDFRGVQAFDANTAIVMSSGKGDLSRLYKTTDGCQTWKLIFTNPDKDGFWDALWAFHRSPHPVVQLKKSTHAMEWSDISATILGDPVHGKFVLWTFDPAETGAEAAPKEWSHLPHAMKQEAAFAASNSALFRGVCTLWLATGGENGSRILEHVGGSNALDMEVNTFRSTPVPIGDHTSSSGIFSFALLPDTPKPGYRTCDRLGVAIGGDYLKPNDSTGTAAFTTDAGKTWIASTTPPHGYRSAVAYDAATKSWLTVGPNGTDISTDDGRNWRTLKPGPNDAPDADQHWNALSLPFIVGPHGRIGLLNPAALQPATKTK